MLDLQNHDGVFVLRMTSGENRLNLPFVQAFGRALDEVESDAAAKALVTVGEGKFYSNGLDLEWMSGPGREQALSCTAAVEALFARLLTFPVITVAAINGHAFAAGAMLAIAHDLRVMRSDRGYFCLPEIDLSMSFTPPMNALITARLSKRAAQEAMVTGKRYAAADSLALGIVHEAVPEAEVFDKALALAKNHGAKPRATLATVKQTLFREVLEITAAHAADHRA
jgi:enoyl-CoA hydratase/carnithine racemase